MTTLGRLATPFKAPPETILVRVIVGLVFLSEGIQKFVYTDKLGEGRFDTIGIPIPGLSAPFVGAVEIVCGALLVAGLATRVAAIPLIIDIAVAIAITKIPVLWGGSADVPDAHGFWGFAHESRTDLAMLFGLVFLLLAGPGRLSLDAYLHPHRPGPRP
jgi:putative oxidoreductase